MALALMNEAEMMYRQFQQESREQRERREMARQRMVANQQSDWDPMGTMIYPSISSGIGGGVGFSDFAAAAAWGASFEASAIADKAKPVPAKPSTKMLDVVEAPELDVENARMGLAVEVEDLLGYSVLRKDVKAPSRLHRLLAELEIDVYADGKVTEYKEKMQAHFQTKADNADRKLIIKMRGMGRRTQTVVRWSLVDLAKYGKPVPEHVLRKCVQIKKAAPEATFQVDELVEETRTLDPFMVVTLGEDKAVIEVWDEPTFEE